MREILFKAKRIDNGEWIIGSLIKTKNDYYICEKPYECMDEYSSLNGQSYGFGGFKFVEPSTICQCTGLVDVNGRKIWENDVVKCIDKNSDSEFIGVVEFGNPNSFYSWGYQLKHIKGDKPNLDILLWIDMEETGATCEVIGNLFDNPQLLKGGAE